MFEHFVRLFIPHHSNNHKPRVLHVGPLLSLVSLLIVAQAGIGLVRMAAPGILGFASNIPPSSIVELTNQERARAGVGPVVLDERLSDAARRKAADMFANNYWAHVSPSGVKPWAFILAAGYDYLHAGENLAKGFTNPETTVAAWMASATHKENIVNGRYQNIGVAVVDGVLNGEDTTLVVQMFGTPQTGVAQVNSGVGSVVPQAVAAQTDEQSPSPAPSMILQKTQTALLLSDITPAPTNMATLVDTPKALPAYDAYWVNKVVSLSFAILIISVLMIDWLVAWRNNLVRLSGKSWAHLTYMAIVLILILIIKQGLIL